jgi:peptidyl-prolyl cis-trans isomerase SurA
MTQMIFSLMGRSMGKGYVNKTLLLICASALFAGVPAGAQQSQTKGEIVEEVVARVNNEIITRGDLDHATKQLRDEVAHDCATCTPGEIDQKLADQQKDLLRDLIDNALLVQRANDMGISVDTQVVKRLDDIRVANNLASLDDLEREVTKSGEDYEDFKNGIRDQLLQQEVIRREVGSKIVVDHAAILKYYDDHKDEYVRPEQVVLRELFVSTEGKTDAEKEALKKKADGLLVRIKNGDDFGELAKRFSDGSTAKQGGDLGTFERGQLAGNLAPVVFKLNKNDVTDVLPTQTGYLILQVEEHYPAGQQPESKVDDEIMNHLYNERMKPTMRTYLDTLRGDSYVLVKPGYVDTAATAAATIDEVPATPDDAGSKAKSGHKKKNGA